MDEEDVKIITEAKNDDNTSQEGQTDRESGGEDLPGPKRRRRRSASNRDRPSTKRQHLLREWCQDNAPTKSGSIDESRLRFSTYAEAYKAYHRDMEQKNEPPYSFSGFCSILYQWAIKPNRYDKYACPLCYLLHHSSLCLEEIANDKHQVQQDTIWPIFVQQVGDLRQNCAKFTLIIMDYSRIHELKAITAVEGSTPSKLSVLSFIVVLNGNKEHVFDYFAYGKQGQEFMKESLDHFKLSLKELIGRNPIMVWSDRGLRSYGTVSNLHELSQYLSQTIIHRFFPPYHGHSRCDTHFGRGKRLLRKFFPDGGLMNTVQVVETFQGLPSTVTNLLSKSFPAPRGSWSGWTTGNGIRSVDAVKFKHGKVYVTTVKKNQIELWTEVPIPAWNPMRAELNKIRVTPYTPIASPIIDPILHQKSFHSQFYTEPAIDYSEDDLSQPSSGGTAFRKSGDPKWRIFNPGRYAIHLSTY